jgi:hypothetical protein
MSGQDPKISVCLRFSTFYFLLFFSPNDLIKLAFHAKAE